MSQDFIIATKLLSLLAISYQYVLFRLSFLIRVGLLGPKKDKYKVCSLLNKAPPNFRSSAAFSCQFCQALRYQNRSKGLVWHYINIDAMGVYMFSFNTYFFLVSASKTSSNFNYSLFQSLFPRRFGFGHSVYINIVPH